MALTANTQSNFIFLKGLNFINWKAQCSITVNDIIAKTVKTPETRHIIGVFDVSAPMSFISLLYRASQLSYIDNRQKLCTFKMYTYRPTCKSRVFKRFER